MFARNALLARKLIFTVSAGFALALALIVALTLVGLHHLEDTNARLEAIVNENNVKTRLANQMRDILRDRAISMFSIAIMSDPFDKDEEMIRFYNYGSSYQQVRLELGSLIHLPQEKRVLASIDTLTRANQPLMVRIVDMAAGSHSLQAMEELQVEGIPLQHQLVKDLDNLIQIQRGMTNEAARTAQIAYTRTRWLMITLGGVALLVAGIVAAAVVRRTARLAAETEQERTKFQTLFETNSDGIVILDEKGFTDCNPATLEMFGMQRVEDFLRRRPEDLGTQIQPGGTPSYVLAQRHIKEAVDSGHAYFEWIARRLDGSTFPADIALHAMRLDGHTVIQAIMRDISSQKEAEAAMRAARDAALFAAEMKSQFVANVSHEIRTPMNGIIGMTQLLLASHLEPRLKEYAEAISSSAESLMRVINDLLDFSKIEAGRLTIEEIDFDLTALLKDVLELYAPRSAAKGLALNLERDANLPAWVKGDPLRIRQILLNLLDNAIKFTKQGEVKLIAEVLGPDGHDLRFTVRDTGIGMSSQVQSRLFQAFTQGDGSVSRKYGGTGLGLAISRQLAELMGGSLSLESVPEQGSRFHLVLSLPHAEPAQQEQSHKTWTLHFPGTRILVAEDNPVNQKLMRYMLERMEVEVMVAENGKSAYDQLASEAVDLVLMDCQMPEWDGLTASRAIRVREIQEGKTRIPILALSANAMAGFSETCLQAGMDDYLSKPLREDDLAAALSRWLPDRARPVPEARHAVAAAGSAEPAAPVVQDRACHFQPEKIHRLCKGDVKQVYEMLRLFLNSTETLLTDLAQAVEQRNGPQAARQAHQIKGACAYLGVEEMVQLASDTDNAAKEKDWDACTTALEDLEAAFIALRLEMEQVMTAPGVV